MSSPPKKQIITTTLYEDNRKVFYKYEQKFAELFEQLPLINALKVQKKWYHFTIYGSSVRRLFEITLKEEREPTLEDLYKHLQTSDIDIHIRNHGKFIIESLLPLIKEMNGYIEYVGNDYSMYDESFRNKTLDQLKEQKVEFLPELEDGHYVIWIPSPIEGLKFIRYDISVIRTTGCQYFRDFLMNSLELNWHCEYTMHDGEVIPAKWGLQSKCNYLDNVFKDIKESKITIVDPITVKKAYRALMLTKKGYTLSEEEKAKFNDIDDNFTSSFCLETYQVPSCGKYTDKIPVTKLQYVVTTKQDIGRWFLVGLDKN